jgi:glycosyltransferase involved in cell wall biosynthesis
MVALVDIAKRNNQKSYNERKILWISFLILDAYLHKTSQLEILRNLAKRGHDTNLIAVRSKNVFQIGDPQVRVISIPLRYIPIISPVMFAVVLLFFLPFYIIVSKPDYIITEPDVSIFGFGSALPFAKLKGIKLVLDVRSTPVETFGFRGYLQTLCFTASVFIARKFFNGMTIVTTLMKEEVCKKFNIDPKFVGVWSNGVSTLFDPNSYVSEGEQLRRKLGLSKKFIILYHGAFSANRGLTETMEAMRIVKRAYSNVVFFLLGTGPIANSLKDLIRMEGLQDNVVIHSSVEYADVPKYIAMSDVGIVPLPNHPFWRFQCPLKLLEYLAMKKVVIATDIPAHRSVIGREKCCVYISSIEPAEIAKAMAYTYENREKLAEWGASGRTIIDEKYRWEKVAEGLENYLLSMDNVLHNLIGRCGEKPSKTLRLRGRNIAMDTR